MPRVGTAGMDLVVVRFVATRKAMGDWSGVRAIVGRCLITVLVVTVLVALVFYLLVPWFFGEVVRMPVAIALGRPIGTSVGIVVGNVFGLLTARRHLRIWTFISVHGTVLLEAITLLTRRLSGVMSARLQR